MGLDVATGPGYYVISCPSCHQVLEFPELSSLRAELAAARQENERLRKELAATAGIIDGYARNKLEGK